jgi:hypothetical protein
VIREVAEDGQCIPSDPAAAAGSIQNSSGRVLARACKSVQEAIK